MKSYVGKPNEQRELIVTVNGNPLNPRLDLATHSPQGFACGYGGLGAAQLALAILADHLADGSQALALHDRFKWAVTAKLSRDGWHLTGDDVERFIASARS